MIEFRHVSKSYRTPAGLKVLLHDFSMVLPTGATIGVLGRNGAGKSTLLGMVAGRCSPTSGRSAAMR